MSKSVTVDTVEGVRLTHPDRIVFDESSVTKVQLAQYLSIAAPVMLPHIVNRPLSVLRCPQGSTSSCFYQKHWTDPLPDGVRSVRIVDADGEAGMYVYVADVRGLIGLVQYGALEFHVWGARVSNVDAPDRIVFDLDPSPDVPWSRVVALALTVRELLSACGLASWVKTTGGKGLHVTAPIARHSTWDDVHAFARSVASHLAAADPTGVVDVASKAARQDRIYVDYQRNARGATAIAPWSTRARAGGPIAQPIEWATLHDAAAVARLTVEQVLRAADANMNDAWTPMLRSRQRLTKRVLEIIAAHG